MAVFMELAAALLAARKRGFQDLQKKGAKIPRHENKDESEYLQEHYCGSEAGLVKSQLQSGLDYVNVAGIMAGSSATPKWIHAQQPRVAHALGYHPPGYAFICGFK